MSLHDQGLRQILVGTDMSMVPVHWDDGTEVKPGTSVYSKNYGTGQVTSIDKGQRAVTFTWGNGNSSIVKAGMEGLASTWRTPYVDKQTPAVSPGFTISQTQSNAASATPFTESPYTTPQGAYEPQGPQGSSYQMPESQRALLEQLAVEEAKKNQLMMGAGLLAVLAAGWYFFVRKPQTTVKG